MNLSAVRHSLATLDSDNDYDTERMLSSLIRVVIALVDELDDYKLPAPYGNLPFL